MIRESLIKRIKNVLGVGLALGVLATSVDAQVPLKVCATVPELGSLVREVGGEEVGVTVFAKGTEDPHYVLAKPSFIKDLNGADLLVLVGLDMEIGWLPTLIQSARNSSILPGGRGYLDASQATTPLELPSGVIDRSMGDVHPLGNPHYLLDPINGLRVSRLIAERLSTLRPERSSYFEERFRSFELRLGTLLVGEELAGKYDPEKLAVLHERGGLIDFLEGQGQRDLLGGWIGDLLPYNGTKVVDDHTMWPYFAARFGLQVVGHMEPRPGSPPTTRHLKGLIEMMKAQNVGVVLTSAYYDPKHADFVAQQTGAAVARMAHQVDSRPGSSDYLSMSVYNVREFLAAVSRKSQRGAA